jgi:hypothetical protein
LNRPRLPSATSEANDTRAPAPNASTADVADDTDRRPAGGGLGEGNLDARAACS